MDREEPIKFRMSSGSRTGLPVLSSDPDSPNALVILCNLYGGLCCVNEIIRRDFLTCQEWFLVKVTALVAT